MSKSKILILILIISIIVNILWISVFYVILYKYDITSKLTENLYPWITKIINKKVVEEKVEEYRQIKDLQSDITKAIEKASPSVVSIVVSKDLKIYYEDPNNFYWWYITQQKTKIWWGSWIIISSDWYLVTNKHVVQDSWLDYTVVTKDWDNYKVDKIWLDPVLDIAVLKILDQNWDVPTNLVAAEINSYENEVKIWDFSIAIWNALAEFANSVTFGIISGKGRQLDETTNDSIYLGLYQTDTPINPWNSWWPLLDIKWSVIGINTAITSSWQWIWFALPVNDEFVKTTLAVIKKYWKIVRPFVWVNYLDLNKSIAKNLSVDKFEWVYIQDIVKGSPADLAWLKKWDVIIDVNWVKLTKDNNFIYQLYTYEPWTEIELLIYTKWDYKKVKIKLSDK